MGIVGGQTDNRGISEIYGTVLIISLTFVVAVALVGVGFLVLSDTTDDAGDRLAQDSILELDDRLTSLTSDSVESSTTWEVPAGTADQFEAEGEDGQINITVRTNETYWEASNEHGALVDADEQVNYREHTLGTITHENDDGVVTVYQGGGVVEMQDGAVSVLRQPDLDVSEDNLDFGFIDLSAIEHIGEGQELVLSQQAEQLDTSDVQEIVDRAMERDGDVIAPAEINLTITSAYAEGWAAFAEDGIDNERVEVWTSDDIASLDSDQVKIGFGEFGDGINLPDAEEPFGDSVIYSGIADVAPELHDEDVGEITDSDPEGFEISDPPSEDYTVGLRYEHEDQGSNWWEWDLNDDRWVNVENPEAEPLASDEIDIVTGVSGDDFEIDDDAWACVVESDGLRDHVDTGGEGCLDEAAGVENPEDSVADFRPLLEVRNIEIDGPNNQQLQFGEDELQVNVTVENTGTADADDEPVAVLTNLADGGAVDPWEDADPWVGAGDRETLEKGEQQTFEYTYQPGFINEEFVIGAGTPGDAEQDSRIWESVRVGDAEDFVIEEAELLGTGPFVEGEDTIEVSATINNTGENSDVQDVLLIDEQDRIQASEEVEIDPGADPNTVILTWETEVGNNAPETSELLIRTQTDEQTVEDVDIQPAEESVADFQIQDLRVNDPVEEREDLDVEVDITNAGDVDGERTIRLRDDEGTIRATVDGVRIDDGETITLGDEFDPLVWETDLGDAGVYDLTVETDDDTNTTRNVRIDPAVTDDTFEVSIDEENINDPVLAGDELSVPVEVEYDGVGTETRNLWLEDFDGEIVNATTVTMSGGEQTSETLVWDTESGDGQQDLGELTANSPGDRDSALAEIRPETEGGPDYEITALTTNSSTDGGSLPADPTTEGDDLEIMVEIENSGDVLGSESVVIEFGDRPVATKEIEIEDGETEWFDLTWETVIGDSTDSPEDITAEIAGETATDEIYIEERLELRDPVDVMFVLDETGSMGTILPGGWMEPTLQADFGWFDEDEFTVPEDITWDEQISDEGEEFWYVHDDREIFETGETAERSFAGHIEFWAGKAFTEEIEVPEDAELWYALPEQNGNIPGGDDVVDPQQATGSADGTFYSSGQTIDPDDHQGTAYVLELESRSDCNLCFDSSGVRYDAVLTALDQLSEETDDRAGLMEFNIGQNVYQPLTENLDQVQDSLRLNPGGGTDITNAVREGQDRLDSLQEPNNKNMILLTDGEHNAGDPQPDQITDEIDDDITVYVVGFGNAEQAEIEPLANAGTGDGEAYFIEEDGDVEELNDIFEEIGEELDEPDLSEFDVEIGDSFDVPEGETLEVPVGIENEGEAGEQIITLTDMYGNVVDSAELFLGAGEEIDAEDDDAPVLEWDAELVVGDEPPEDGQLLVRTPNDEQRADVTVTAGDPSNFVVDVTDVEPSDPQATDEIDVTVDIENQQPGSDTQTVVLRDYNDNPIDVRTIELDGVGGDTAETTETFTWQTTSRDAGDGRTITVETDDDAETQTVDIAEAPGAADEFEVEIVSASDPITAGDELDVELRVENVGEDPGTQWVELRNFADNVVGLEEVQLDSDPADNSTTFDMTWQTAPGDGGTDDVRVTTRDDETERTVEIENIEGTDSEFEITDAELNDTVITAGENIELDVAVENTGEDMDQQYVEAEFENTVETEQVDLDSGEATSPPLEFEFSTATRQGGETYDIEIRTEDDTETVEIEIEPAPGATLDVTIEETDDPVEAGEALDVDVEVTGLNSDSTVSLVTPYGSMLEPADIEAVSEPDDSVTLTWQTQPGEGSPEPQEITVRTQDVTATEAVTVERAPEGDIDAPGTGPGGNPVGIDIDEIEVT